jgi:hypothetical protein
MFFDDAWAEYPDPISSHSHIDDAVLCPSHESSLLVLSLSHDQSIAKLLRIWAGK